MAATDQAISAFSLDGLRINCGHGDGVYINTSGIGVIARYAAEVNGLTDIALTKLDVLSAFDEIKICVAYECNGERYEYFPMQQSVLYHAKPIYKTMPGWKGQDITKATAFEELPQAAQDYIAEIERLSGVKATIVSVGPEHAMLAETGRVRYVGITDDEALDAFKALSRFEGIIPAMESSHAIAQALKMARELAASQESGEDVPLLLVNLSGRGDKDMEQVADKL